MRDAASGWRRSGLDARIAALRAVQSMVPAHVDAIAEAISCEMGKTIAEARVKARSIAGKIDGVIGQIHHELPPAPPGAPGQQRFHPLGVMGIVGPFNFPIHLLNTHVIPALLTGNSVVIKPSEVTPLCGQRYAELFADAGFPPGVLNMVQGGGTTGARLVEHDGVDGIVFTGSYSTGRRIRQRLLTSRTRRCPSSLVARTPQLFLMMPILSRPSERSSWAHF